MIDHLAAHKEDMRIAMRDNYHRGCAKSCEREGGWMTDCPCLEIAQICAAATEGTFARVDQLERLINSPVVDDWFQGVRIEAAHQQERWGSSHDAGKTPIDWFWLLGYLGGKALASAIAGNIDKAKHHTVSSGAAMFNWWRALNGDPDAKMRPGTDRTDA